MKTRFNAYNLKNRYFQDTIYIACGSCDSKVAAKKLGSYIKVVCTLCGYHKTSYNRFPVEDYWLSIELPYGVLWAYNYEHLEVIRQHVAAELRERNMGYMQNNSIGSRLPKWISSKKNRVQVLKAIEKLKKK